jgi:hypothetical protein
VAIEAWFAAVRVNALLPRRRLSRMPHNKQLQRTVIRRRGRGASAPFHYAFAPRWTGQRAAAELRRSTAWDR